MAVIRGRCCWRRSDGRRAFFASHLCYHKRMTAIRNLEALFARVQKPARYTGGEWNSIVKDWDACDVRAAFAYPDLYDIGMSNLGLGILYDIVNRREGMLAERVFAPWPDMEAVMRAEGVPLWSLETRHPLGEFDMHRLLAELRGDVHEHPEHARPGGPAGARRRARRTASAGRVRRLRRAQPGRAGGLRRRVRAGRRRGADPRHRRLRARVEAAGGRLARRDAAAPVEDLGRVRTAVLPPVVQRRRDDRIDRPDRCGRRRRAWSSGSCRSCRRR